MHHVDRGTPWDEIWQAMEILVQQGKVLYVGSSNFAGWQIAQACASASARHFLGLDRASLQLGAGGSALISGVGAQASGPWPQSRIVMFISSEP